MPNKLLTAYVETCESGHKYAKIKGVDYACPHCLHLYICGLKLEVMALEARIRSENGEADAK